MRKAISKERQIAKITYLTMLDSLQQLKSKNQWLDIEEVMYCLAKEIESDLCVIREQRIKKKSRHTGMRRPVKEKSLVR